MKNYYYIFFLFLLFFSCEGPQGPQGPVGPPGSAITVFFNGTISSYDDYFIGRSYSSSFQVYNCPSLPVLIIDDSEYSFTGVPQNPFCFSINSMLISSGDSLLISISFFDNNIQKEAHADIEIPELEIIFPDPNYQYNPNYDISIGWTDCSGIEQYNLGIAIRYKYYDPQGQYHDIDFFQDTLVYDINYVLESQSVTTLPVIVDSLVYSDVDIYLNAEKYTYLPEIGGNVAGDAIGNISVSLSRYLNLNPQ